MAKKNVFREVLSSPFVSPFSQSVPCFSHVPAIFKALPQVVYLIGVASIIIIIT